MFKDKTIRKRVIAIIDERIKTAQAKYDVEVVKIDDAHEAEVEKLEAKVKTDKVALADKLVKEVITI